MELSSHSASPSLDLDAYIESRADLSPASRREYRRQSRAIITSLCAESGCLEGEPAQPVTLARLERARHECHIRRLPPVLLDWIRQA